MNVRLVALLILILAGGCGFQRPLEQNDIIWSSPDITRSQVFERLENAAREEGLPLRQVEPGRGLIVTDSFDVLTSYCDCGRNLLGSEYIGERRGVMKIRVTQGDSTTVRFEFITRLKITANGKFVICGSLGVLEERLLVAAGLKAKAEANQLDE